MKKRWLDPRTFARRSFSSSSGQGIVEYILLIVIVISVALAVSATFFKPFNEWASNYVGDYIFCLLDQAELPALGGEETVSECDKGFENFTFGSGRPPKDGGGAGDGDGGGDDNRGARSRLNRANNAGDTGGGGASGRRRSRMNLGAGFDGGAGAAGRKISDVSDQFGSRRSARSSGGFGSRRTEISARASRYVGITGYLAQERERVARREEKIRTVGRTADMPSSFARGKNKMQEVSLSSKRRADYDITSGDWSFGEMFRMLLIIVIIIALVLFVGSQVMQISKSMEKGE